MIASPTRTKNPKSVLNHLPLSVQIQNVEPYLRAHTHFSQ
jgi:hypothetical protein